MDVTSSLNQLENDVHELREQLKKNNDELLARLDRLLLVVDSKASAVSSSVSNAPHRVISDNSIPACYGSIELREAMEEAQLRLRRAAEIVRKVRGRVPMPFVGREMDSLLNNFDALRDVFGRMVDRMEPNRDFTSEEALSL